MTYDVIILGSGPAGYTAGLYTSRAFLKTLMLTGLQEGGQLTTTTEVENFPGFAKGILGPQLMLDMKAQVLRFGADIKQESATKVEKSGNVFRITAGNSIYEGKTVIVATGASAMYLGLPSEQVFAGKGVSACATCDGFFFRGKEVVVVGGGDTAMEEANFLTTFAAKVTIVHRREEFRASAVMLDRAKKNKKIAFLLNKQVMEVLGETNVTGIRIKDNKTGKEEIYPAQGFFLAIGHRPNTGFLQGLLPLDAKGYVETLRSKNALEPQTATAVSGLFAAGDCVDPRYRQAIVAAGMGCQAALDAQKYLEEHE